MSDDDGTEAMAQACIAAHEAVKVHGSSELRLLTELLLFTLGREMADRLKAKALTKRQTLPHPRIASLH